MSKTNLDFLIKNKDIKSEAEFYEMLKEDKSSLIKDLKWRANGGLMKNEIIDHHVEYMEQCKQLLIELEN